MKLSINQDKIETEFLSLLFLQSEKTYPLLQIKPSYLLNPVNQKIFELIIKSYEKNGVVSGSYIVNELKPYEMNSYNALNDTEYVMPAEVIKHFTTAQEIILERYKSHIQDTLIEKFKKGEITREELARKTILLEDIALQKPRGKLTKEYLSEPSKEKRIYFKKYKELNKYLKLIQNDFLVIGAKTGNGKTSLMLNLMADLMEDYQCIYFNMETSPQTIKERIISITANVPVDDIESPNTDDQKSLIDNAIDKISSCDVYVEDEYTELEEIENYIKPLKARDGRHTIIFLDHLGLIGADGIKNNYEKTTWVMKKLRKLCIRYNCTIISASQLNRSAYNAEELDLSMLKDSGEVENSSSKVILLYRQKDYSSDHTEPEMILNIAKNRNGFEGKTSLIYEKTKQIFRDKKVGIE